MDFNKKELLFRYELTDAWHQPIFELIILDKKEKNIFMSTDYIETMTELPSLHEEDIEKIKEIINNEEIYEIDEDEIESPMVLDGYINVFTFNNGKKVKQFYAYNMRFLEIKDTKYAKILKKCFDRVSRVVYKRTYVKMPL